MAKRARRVYNSRMTTAISAVEDLVSVLDDNPELLEATRARLLTRELLEMPNILARFAAETDRRDRENDRRLDGMDRVMHRRKTDLSILKMAYVRNVAQRDYGWMALIMGLQSARLLPVEEVDELALKLRETGVSGDDLENFRKSDMIIAADARGETVYIAVEVAFTVSRRHTGRAIRNARCLTRVTGKPASAAVIGLSLDNGVRALIESGEVYWRPLVDKYLQPE